MPTYQFINKQTQERFKETMTISEMEQHLKDHPELDVIPGTPIIGYNYTRKKPDEDFRSILKKIKKDNKGSTINVP